MSWAFLEISLWHTHGWWTTYSRFYNHVLEVCLRSPWGILTVNLQPLHGICSFSTLSMRQTCIDREEVSKTSQGDLRDVIVKPVMTDHMGNSFVTTNERPLFGRMRPVHDTWAHAINQPHGALFSLVTRALAVESDVNTNSTSFSSPRKMLMCLNYMVFP